MLPDFVLSRFRFLCANFDLCGHLFRKDKIIPHISVPHCSSSSSSSFEFGTNSLPFLVAMGVASVIHNGAHIPLKFNSGLPRVSSRSPSPIWSRPHRILPLLRTGGRHCRGGQSVPIVCSRATEQGDDVSTSEGEKVDPRSYDGISNVDTSHTSTPDKIKGAEAYVTSVRTVAFWVCAAVAFGVGVGFKDGVGKATEFFAGYLLEQSLSVDNLFVFVLIFKYFKVPLMYQGRVLSYGIAGAVIFRLTLILLGTVTLQRFEVVNLFLAAILLYSSFKLFSSEEDDTDLSDNFVVKTCQRFIPVTASYDGNRFFTIQDGVQKVSNILGRPHLYFSR